jgi:hypothetical protein
MYIAPYIHYHHYHYHHHYISYEKFLKFSTPGYFLVAAYMRRRRYAQRSEVWPTLTTMMSNLDEELLLLILAGLGQGSVAVGNIMKGLILPLTLTLTPRQNSNFSIDRGRQEPTVRSRGGNSMKYNKSGPCTLLGYPCTRRVLCWKIRGSPFLSGFRLLD